MRKAIPISLAISLFWLSCSESENKEAETAVKLSFHPEKGIQKDFEYDVIFESPSNKAVLNYHMELAMEIMNSNEENTEVKYTYKSVQFEGKVDTLDMKLDASQIDSTQIEARVYAEPYFVCLNHQFLISYNKKMNKISEELITRKDSMSLTAPTHKAPFFTTLPDTEVTVGTKWKDKVELKSGQGMVVTAKFEVTKMDENSVFLKFHGDLDGKGEGFGQNFSMKGKVSGTIEVESTSGLTLHSEMVQDLILVMNEKEVPMKFTIKQHIK